MWIIIKQRWNIALHTKLRPKKVIFQSNLLRRQMQLRDATGKCKSWQPASGSSLLTWERELALCIWVGWPQNWHLQQYAAALPDAAQMPAQPMQRQRKSASHPTAPPSHLAFHCCDQLRFDFFFIGLSKRSNGVPVLNLFLDLQVILWLRCMDAFSLVRYRQRCSKQKGKLFQKLFHGKHLNF